MKKVLRIILAAVMVFALAACGSTSGAGSEQTENNTNGTTEAKSETKTFKVGICNYDGHT